MSRLHPARTAALALAVLAPPAAATGWPELSRPPAVATRDGARDAALVIAIEDYAFAQDLPGAVANGKDWVSWLQHGRGVPFVKPLFNHQATRPAMLAEAQKVARQVQPGGRLWLVYIGHGAPAESGFDGLLVGVDAQQTPESIEDRGLPRGELLKAVEAALPQGAELVLVQDACFSGKTSRGDLAPGMAPLRVVSSVLGPRMTVLSAARSDEYAGPLSDGARPAFSYLVLGALRGWGDRDADGVITAGEAVGYANRALLQTVTGRSQTAEHAGPDIPLGRSARERGPDLMALALATPAAGPHQGPAVGQVTIQLGGQATDFAALQLEAVAADRALVEAAKKKAAAEEALQQERRRRLDAARAEVQTAASRDFHAIQGLVEAPSVNGKRVLEAWLARYADASVTIDGVTEPVPIPEVYAVQAALKGAERAAAPAAAPTRAPAAPSRPPDFTALAREAAAAHADRRARLAAATAVVQRQATVEYEELRSLVRGTPSEDSAALAAFIRKYSKATVVVDGVEFPVAIPELTAARAELADLHGRGVRAPTYGGFDPGEPLPPRARDAE